MAFAVDSRATRPLPRTPVRPSRVSSLTRLPITPHPDAHHASRAHPIGRPRDEPGNVSKTPVGGPLNPSPYPGNCSTVRPPPLRMPSRACPHSRPVSSRIRCLRRFEWVESIRARRSASSSGRPPRDPCAAIGSSADDTSTRCLESHSSGAGRRSTTSAVAAPIRRPLQWKRAHADGSPRRFHGKIQRSRQPPRRRASAAPDVRSAPRIVRLRGVVSIPGRDPVDGFRCHRRPATRPRSSGADVGHGTVRQPTLVPSARETIVPPTIMIHRWPLWADDGIRKRLRIAPGIPDHTQRDPW